MKDATVKYREDTLLDLLNTLRECITEEGAYCLQDNDASEMIDALTRRIEHINEIVRAAIEKAEGTQ